MVSKPRPDWQKTVESQGLTYHSIGGVPYWDESAFYLLSSDEVDRLEAATYDLDRMCLQAAQHVLDQNRLAEFDIPEAFYSLVRQSWDRDEFTLYGRFDLAFDTASQIKLLEYNADTPTALIEAAVAQWFWMKDLYPDADQFNSIHERLIEAWKAYRPRISPPMYFTAVTDSEEDFATITYLQDTAMQAGIKTESLPIEQLGWHAQRRVFTDPDEREVTDLFKLYPWEWLVREDFGPMISQAPLRWLEAPWKMLLSNKAILAVLWELFPDSPYLLPASLQPLSGSYVRKPILGREGANVAIFRGGQAVSETEGEYGEPWIYQALCNVATFGGHTPIIGSWMINGYAAGIGIREDTGPVTGNTSRFVPHIFR